MPKYKIVTINKIDKVTLREWSNLWQNSKSSTIFNSPEWFLACTRTFNIPSYTIYKIYLDNSLVAIFPVKIGRRFGVNVIEPLCGKYLYGSTFLVLDGDKKLFEILLREVTRHNNLFIPKINKDYAIFIKESFGNSFTVISAVSPYLSLSREPFRMISKSARKIISKLIASHSDDFLLKKIKGKKDLLQALKIMFIIENVSTKKYRGREIFSQNESRAFYTNLIKYCSKYVRIDLLYFKKKPIAYSYNFEYGNEVLGYQTAYRARYKKLIPGKIMTKYLLDKLGSDGFQKFDFGAGISSYKMEFTDTYNYLFDVYISKNYLYLLWWVLINRVRRLKQVLYPENNTHDHEYLFKEL